MNFTVRTPHGSFNIRAKVDRTEAQELVGAVRDRAKALRPFWEQVGAITREAIDQNFAQAGPGWQPLAPSTVKQKARMGLPHPTLKVNKRGRAGGRKVPGYMVQLGRYGASSILLRTGKMRQALTDNQADGNVTEIEERAAFFGLDETAIPYAGYHEHGTDRIPIRRMTTLRPRDLERIGKVGVHHLLGTKPTP